MTLHTIATAVPPPAIMRVLERFDREALKAFVTVAIDLMDLTDGDTDGEELWVEDSFLPHMPGGPGCPIADPDYCTAHDDNPGKMLGDFKAGDPDDAEADGDEEDHNFTEDEFVKHYGQGAGCPISDPGGGADDDMENASHSVFI